MFRQILAGLQIEFERLEAENAELRHRASGLDDNMLLSQLDVGVNGERAELRHAYVAFYPEASILAVGPSTGFLEAKGSMRPLSPRGGFDIEFKPEAEAAIGAVQRLPRSLLPACSQPVASDSEICDDEAPSHNLPHFPQLPKSNMHGDQKFQFHEDFQDNTTLNSCDKDASQSRTSMVTCTDLDNNLQDEASHQPDSNGTVVDDFQHEMHRQVSPSSPSAEQKHHGAFSGIVSAGWQLEHKFADLAAKAAKPAQPGSHGPRRASVTGLRLKMLEEEAFGKVEDEDEDGQGGEWDNELKMFRTNTLHAKESLYKRSKYAAEAVVASAGFESFICIVMIIDGLLVGVEAQNNASPSLDSGQLTFLTRVGLTIKAIFMIELCLRFHAYGVLDSLRVSGWIRFDSVLVVCSVTEILAEEVGGIMIKEGAAITILRVVRLARLARAARLTVQFRTLWLLLSGLQNSFGTMLWTFVLIAVIAYVFAIFGMQSIPPQTDVYEDTPYNVQAIANFKSLPVALLTLLQVLTLDSIAGIYRPLIEPDPNTSPLQNIVCAVYFITFILMVSVALMNLVTAVMVEGSLKQANEDKEFLRRVEKTRRKKVIPRLKRMFDSLDQDGSGIITWEELEAAPDELTEELKVFLKTDDLRTIFELLDNDGSGQIETEEFLEGVLKASSSDEIVFRVQIQRVLKILLDIRSDLGAKGLSRQTTPTAMIADPEITV